MRVAIVVAGSTTVRVLVAGRSGTALTPVHEESTYVGLAEEARDVGGISRATLQAAAGSARAYVSRARDLGADRVEILVTAPGREAANARELVAALVRACAAPARILSEEEEAHLVYEGAVAASSRLPDTAAVCAVGATVTHVVVGAVATGPVWMRSLPVGALRLTERLLWDDPPSKRSVLAARAEVAGYFERFTPPLARGALVSGASAEACGALAGRRLGAHDLAGALEELVHRPSDAVARRFGLERQRARTLLAATLILAELQRRLAVPLRVARGGLQEGAALALLAELEAA